MSIIEPGLFRVFERFPDRKDTAKALFRKSDSFQSLCEDYRQCAKALQYWSHSSADCALVRRREYAVLLQELEQELLQRLDKC
jgi:hypothetical protein